LFALDGLLWSEGHGTVDHHHVIPGAAAHRAKGVDV
jgi:hypothetical protein